MMDIKTRNEIDECMNNAIMARELLGVLCNKYLDKSYEYHSETKAHDLLVHYDSMVALATASFDYLAKALDMYDDLTNDTAKEEPNTVRVKVIKKEPEKQEEPNTVRVKVVTKEPEKQEPKRLDNNIKWISHGSEEDRSHEES